MKNQKKDLELLENGRLSYQDDGICDIIESAIIDLDSIIPDLELIEKDIFDFSIDNGELFFVRPSENQTILIH